jgi:hypothetical protein
MTKDTIEALLNKELPIIKSFIIGEEVNLSKDN